MAHGVHYFNYQQLNQRTAALVSVFSATILRGCKQKHPSCNLFSHDTKGVQTKTPLNLIHKKQKKMKKVIIGTQN